MDGYQGAGDHFTQGSHQGSAPNKNTCQHTMVQLGVQVHKVVWYVTLAFAWRDPEFTRTHQCCFNTTLTY